MSDDHKTLTFDGTNFQSEVLESPYPVLVDFWAPWCAPCRIVAPAVEELAQEFADQVKVGKVNVDDNPDLAIAYGVQGIPALFVFQNGEVVDRVLGAVPKQVLTEKLQACVSPA